MIYTCYEMIRDCRADRPEGWAHLITAYVPMIRQILAHYQRPASPPDVFVERVLLALRQPDSSLFQTLEPAPERFFIAELRQKVLAELDTPAPAIEIDIETLAAALEPLTLTEKQATWLETMGYSPAEAGPLLRMAPATVEKIRAKASDLIRGKTDSWSRTILADNGRQLGRAAAAAGGLECLSPKPFLDMLDGRTSWDGRGQLERHVTGCWHCIDHFARLAEVIELLRGIRPLTEEEAAPYRQLLDLPLEKGSAWKRWLRAEPVRKR